MDDDFASSDMEYERHRTRKEKKDDGGGGRDGGLQRPLDESAQDGYGRLQRPVHGAASVLIVDEAGAAGDRLVRQLEPDLFSVRELQEMSLPLSDEPSAAPTTTDAPTTDAPTLTDEPTATAVPTTTAAPTAYAPTAAPTLGTPAFRVEVTSDLTLADPLTCDATGHARTLEVFENATVDLAETAMLFYNVSSSCTLTCDPGAIASDGMVCVMALIQPERKDVRRRLLALPATPPGDRRSLAVGREVDPRLTVQVLEILKRVWQAVLQRPEDLNAALEQSYVAAAVPEGARAYLLLGEGERAFLAGGRWSEVCAVDEIVIPVAHDGGGGDGGAGGDFTLPPLPWEGGPPQVFWYPKIRYGGKQDNRCFSNSGYPERYIASEVLDDGFDRLLFRFETIAECCAIMYPWDVSVLIGLVRAAQPES